MPDIPGLTYQAIQAALKQSWDEAVDLNLHILQHQPNDIGALNRLAKAYEKMADLENARRTFRQVLKIDRFNNIATTNLQRLTTLKKAPSQNPDVDSSFSFIEEPGKTKSVSLTKLAPHQVIAALDVSQMVQLKAQKRRIIVTTLSGTYIGSFPDDLSLHLARLLKLGYKYQAAIKSLSRSTVEILVQEVYRSKRLKGISSFPLKDTLDYYNLLPTEPISEVPLELPEPEEEEILE